MVEAARSCGTCSLCCKLPYVQELKKSIDTWCQHCRPGKGGCAIYCERPLACREFTCLWLAGDVGDEWFPARCKMVLEQIAENYLFITVDPTFPHVWRLEPYYSTLRSYSSRGLRVEVRIGHRFFGLEADGSEIEVYRSQAHIEGRP
jgi:uncharacterized protein